MSVSFNIHLVRNLEIFRVLSHRSSWKSKFNEIFQFENVCRKITFEKFQLTLLSNRVWITKFKKLCSNYEFQWINQIMKFHNCAKRIIIYNKRSSSTLLKNFTKIIIHEYLRCIVFRFLFRQKRSREKFEKNRIVNFFISLKTRWR